MYYDYEMLTNDIDRLVKEYPFIEKSVIGRSVKGKQLYMLKIGEGKHEVFINGAHHGLEWLTSPLLMRYAEDFARTYVLGGRLRGYNIRDLYKRSCYYIMPMVNPDGVDLVLSGVDKYANWQANARGVDLNHNYDASWEKFKEMESDYGIFAPGPTRYSGKRPESEPEVQAIVSFVRSHSIRVMLCMHSQGEEIFWDFEGLEPQHSYRIARRFSKVSGYKVSVPTGIASGGGCKDWFIKEFNRPGFTIEVGRGKNPLPIEQLDKIYSDVLEIFLISSIIV